MSDDERWLPVNDYPGYEVSDQGNVRSLDREVGGRWGARMWSGRVLKQVWAGGTKDRHYRAVTLHRNGIAKQITVHTLVLQTFVGPRPAKLQGCHRDDDPDNNQLSNLYWGRNGRCWKSNITNCPQGHEYTEDNTYIIPSTGHRMCRACLKAKNKGNAN